LENFFYDFFQQGFFMKIKLPIKIPDVVIIMLALGLTAFSAFASYIKPRSTAQVLIEGINQNWIFPLDAEETVKVKGPMGDTVVRIHENEVWIESSPCGNQTCVAMGHVRSKGDWVACLPNNVFFVIEGSDDSRQITDTATW
jgi:hypothetical protein